MTPAARIAAAVTLLEQQEAQPRRPADAVANEFFRARRYIGGGDRRAVAEIAWGVVRERLRLDWHLGRVGGQPTPRLLVATYMLMASGESLQAVLAAFSGERHAEAPLEPGERRVLSALRPPLLRPEMPEEIRLNIPGWALPGFASVSARNCRRRRRP